MGMHVTLFGGYYLNCTQGACVTMKRIKKEVCFFFKEAAWPDSPDGAVTSSVLVSTPQTLSVCAPPTCLGRLSPGAHDTPQVQLRAPPQAWSAGRGSSGHLIRALSCLTSLSSSWRTFQVLFRPFPSGVLGRDQPPWVRGKEGLRSYGFTHPEAPGAGLAESRARGPPPRAPL